MLRQREDLADKRERAHGKRKHFNHIFNWQAGDKTATDAAFAKADVTINQLIVYPRVHPCPLETCQCVASFDKIKGELALWGTFQAPHVIRTAGSLISKIPEHKIHVISPDIGGGFGNKVGAYSGYICAIVASIVTGRPVKWVEDRIENLSTTAFARDFHMQTEIAATKDGRVTALRCYTIADHGAFDACANATKWPAGLFSIITGSYDFPAAHVSVDGVYTNKAPGGVAYRCSFRVTEAAYCVERDMERPPCSWSTKSIERTRSSRHSCWSCFRTFKSAFLSLAQSRQPRSRASCSHPTAPASSLTRCAGAVSIIMWIFPDVDRKANIIVARIPGIAAALALQIAGMVAAVRKEDLRKVPGVAETLDWVATLVGLEIHDLRQEPEAVYETIICLLKTHEDRARFTREVSERLLGKVA